MTTRAFQSSFNPVTNYLWPYLDQNHPNAPYKTLWVAGLPPDTTEREIRSMFSPMGGITTLEIICSGVGQTLALISYRHWFSGITALCTLNDHSICGRKIRVTMYVDDAHNRRQPGRSSTVLLYGLADGVSNMQIFNHLRKFGLILSLNCLKNTSLNSRNNMRVEFLEEGNAKAAIRRLNMSLFGGRCISVGLWSDKSNSISSSRSSTGKLFVPVPLSVVQASSTLNLNGLDRDNNSRIDKPLKSPPASNIPPLNNTSHAFGTPPLPAPEMQFIMKPMLSPTGVNIDVHSLVLRDVNIFSQTGAPTYGQSSPASVLSSRFKRLGI